MIGLFKASTIALLPSLISAHFLLNFPPSCGFEEEIENQFCGGFPDVLNPRQPFPLGAAPIVIDSRHASAEVAIQISLANNPSTFANFSTSAGVALPLVKGFSTIVGQGIYCLNVDIASLNIPGVTNGTNATLQFVFNGGDGALYQCSDIVLSSSFTASSASCVNTTATARQSNASASPAAAIASTSATSGTSASSATTVVKSTGFKNGLALGSILSSLLVAVTLVSL